MNKKGLEAIWWTVIVVMILLIAAGVLLFAYNRWFNQGAVNIDKMIDGFNDCDNDKIINLYDQCPCQPKGSSESETASGCPNGVSPPGDLSGGLTVSLPGFGAQQANTQVKCSLEACKKLAGQ